MAKELSSKSVVHHAFLLSYLASSYEKEDVNLDLTFVCKGGKVIKAHQLVLASVSPFLRELFNESKTPEVSISLSEVDDRLLSQLLTLMYEGTLKLFASDARELQELIEMLGIRFPGDMYINSSPPLRYTPQNGMDEVSSSAMAILSMDSVNEFIGKTTVGGPNDDPLNIPDRYFVKPKAGGTGQPNVKPVQLKPAGHKASVSEKISNRKLRESSTSPSEKLSTEGRASHTGASEPSTETSATNEGTSHPDASNGSVHNEAGSSASDSVGRSDPGGLRKRKRATENAGEKLNKKKARSKDKESNLT